MIAGTTDVALGKVDWSYVSRPFQALGHRFVIRATEPGIGSFFEGIYDSLPTAQAPATIYSIVDSGSDPTSRRLYVDGRLVGSIDRLSWLVRYLTWHVNHEVIGRSSAYVLIHAAMASRDGIGVLLPGAPEAGKTTLAAGLVRAGFQYLTDEAAAIDPTTLEVEPYPKPLSIDPGSWEILADLAPHQDELSKGFHDGQWQVRPDSIRPEAVAGRIAVSVIVFPSFQKGRATTFEPVKGSEALLRLVGQTFRFQEDGRRNFQVLGRMLRRIPSFELVSGDLDASCAAVLAAVDELRMEGM